MLAVLGDGGEGELDVGAGGVAAGVEDARRGVRPLAGEGDLAVLGVERHAEAHEVVDAVGGLGGEDAGGLGVDEAGAGGDRVVECFWGESPGPMGAAMPPWAQRVLQSSMEPLVMTSTEPCSRARRAAYSPAMPEPTMM